MSPTQAHPTKTLASSPRWLTRGMLRRSVLYYVVACMGYLANVLSMGHLNLARFLLLTIIYGAWVGFIHIGRMLGVGNGISKRLPLWWLFAVFCLACASQFIPSSNAGLNWLPILPTTTACLIIALTTRPVGVIMAVALWMSSSLGFCLIMHGWDLNAQLTLLLSFISFVGFTVAMRELTLAHMALESSNAELAVAHGQLQDYSTQVEEMAAIRERNRIAREIHDTLGHSLTLLAVQLETATQFQARGDPGLRGELVEARRVAKACLADVRHSVEALRPDHVATGTLPERLRRLADEFAATSRETTITLDLEEATRPLNAEMSLTLYRCAQEALTNIRKHARATKVLLFLGTTGAPGESVELTVLDNGQGSASENDERAPGFGLRGMRERVALLRGTMRAGPEPGHGWRVAVELPLDAGEHVTVRAHAAGAAKDEE